MFKPFGKVRDIFLSSKKTFRRSCYAFIRFETLEEDRKVALMVDGMHIYGWPINTKVVEYDWNDRRPPLAKPSRRDNFHVGRNRADRREMNEVEEITVQKDRRDKGRILVLASLGKEISCDVKVLTSKSFFVAKLVESQTSVAISWVNKFLELSPLNLNILSGIETSKSLLPRDVRECTPFKRCQSDCDSRIEKKLGRLNAKDKEVKSKPGKLNSSFKSQGLEMRVEKSAKESLLRFSKFESNEGGKGKVTFDKGKGRWIQKLRPKPIWFPRFKSTLNLEKVRKDGKLLSREGDSSSLGYETDRGNFFVLLKECTKSLLEGVSCSKDLEEEVAVVVETGENLGFDFNGNEEKIALVASSMEREDEAWQSKVKWLLEGDRNSKFFQCVASERRRKNSIEEISFEGVKISNQEEIRYEVTNFFSKLFQNVGWKCPTITGLPLKKLLCLENAFWEDKFSKDEVLEALHSCDGNKAPGPDGFNIKFIKDNWEVIEGDFMKFMDEFYRDGSIVKELNKTFIAVIPKCIKPESMKDYRPIRLIEDMVRFRVGWWFKNCGRGSLESITHIILNITELCTDVSKNMFSRTKGWLPPSLNALKFNVDGSTWGNSGAAGIGGVLQDHRENVLCIFSTSVGFQDAITTEILAIAIACDLFAFTPELANKNLLVG
ncbi:hypothetical protein Ddye_014049 [Dipteronia dyeriana]|uniref:RRM domain-containing protein n=1 Tax=Dipteronia dyeriana TaxID=168575 RepID=A0AAE0CKS7_9ROSI|nr:hypothetical protein Ddye_014049 [Dipteronia dyeriana]